tara:strand:- start:207 stop:893 length:687 start_codon:yes stop_codon:yes gene_type:complete
MDPNDRKGVLTHPAWLAAHGSNFEDGASIVYRGKWIRENLLCEVIPPLEFVTVEAQLIPSDPEKSARRRMEESVEGLIPLEDGSYDDQSGVAPYATCMSCHDKMNSLGKPFEMYNHAGFVRERNHGDERYGDGVTITNFPGASGDVNVDGAIELTELLANSSHVKKCFMRQTFRYFMGRDETPADSCTLSAMEAAYDQQGSFKDALKALVNSDTFLYRHHEVENGGGQ